MNSYHPFRRYVRLIENSPDKQLCAHHYCTFGKNVDN